MRTGYVQAYQSFKEGWKPRHKFTTNHINDIILLCFGLSASSNKSLMLAVLYEAVQKAPEKIKAPEITASEDDKTPTAEPFSEKEGPVVDQRITEV